MEQFSSDEDDLDGVNPPAAVVYQSPSVSTVEALGDLRPKAEADLAAAR